MKEFAANPTLALRCKQIDESNDIVASMMSYRDVFMSDRDRIMYCKSFLRMAGKTQVYAPSKGDHQRTRLTHTLEVSQIARTISNALGLNQDLTEAIALGHDIGHTPFGHAGERMLHEIMSPTNDREAQTPKATTIYKLTSSESQQEFQECYGFKHNLQSVRATIEDLESRSETHGLNLCNYTLWGIAHHSDTKYKLGKVTTDFVVPLFYQRYEKYWRKKDGTDAWTFEAFVVAEADEIAQMHHDLEDAIRMDAISKSAVMDLIGKLENLMNRDDAQCYHELKIDSRSKEFLISSVSKILVNTLVTKLVESSEANFAFLKAKYHDAHHVLDLDITHAENALVKYAIGYDFLKEENMECAVRKQIEECQKELSDSVLFTYDVQRTDSKGKYIIKNLFEAYYTNPQQLPDSALKNLYKALQADKYNFNITDEYYKIDSSKLRIAIKTAVSDIRKKHDIAKDIWIMRIICDYIAGMTDSFAINEYEKLYG